MIKISPEQRAYKRIRKLCEDLDYNVYDRVPDDATFPFVIIGEQFSQRVRDHKEHTVKDVQTTIHIWHNDWKQRGTVSRMIRELEIEIMREFGVEGEDISTQIILDNTTGTDMYHGIVEPDIRM